MTDKKWCDLCQNDPPIRARGGSPCPRCGHTQESRIAADEAMDELDPNDVCTDCGTPGPHLCPAGD